MQNAKKGCYHKMNTEFSEINFHLQNLNLMFKLMKGGILKVK